MFYRRGFYRARQGFRRSFRKPQSFRPARAYRYEDRPHCLIRIVRKSPALIYPTFRPSYRAFRPSYRASAPTYKRAAPAYIQRAVTSFRRLETEQPPQELWDLSTILRARTSASRAQKVLSDKAKLCQTSSPTSSSAPLTGLPSHQSATPSQPALQTATPYTDRSASGMKTSIEEQANTLQKALSNLQKLVSLITSSDPLKSTSTTLADQPTQKTSKSMASSSQ